MGRFITIEGPDGSGKGTQAKLLAAYAEKQGYTVLEISFPRYGRPAAYFVEQYLNGNYGANGDIVADLTALPFAIDRFAAREEISDFLAKPHSIVIADRYVASNLAHQGAKIADDKDRRAFYERMLNLEYTIFAIPRPDINILLSVPPQIAQANVDKKAARSYTNKKRDILEADKNHLELAKRNFEEIAELFADSFVTIPCLDEVQKLRSIDAIQADIHQATFS